MVQEKDHGGFPHVHLLRLPCEFAGDRGTVPICPPATTDNDARRDAVTQCRTRTENPADLAGQGSPFSRPPFFPSFLSASLRLCVRYNSFLGRMLHTSIQSPHPRSSTEGLRPGWIAFDAFLGTGGNIRPLPRLSSPLRWHPRCGRRPLPLHRRRTRRFGRPFASWHPKSMVDQEKVPDTIPFHGT